MTRVHFVASGGGHLDLLRAVAGRLRAPHDAIWLTTPGRGLDSLRAAGAVAEPLTPIDQDTADARSAARSVATGARAAWRARPELIVTSGAGLVVPFVAVARGLGARVLFAETMARVGDASRAAKVLGRLSEQVAVQWPESALSLPGATVTSPLLLEHVTGGTPPHGVGTYVSFGTHHGDFSRLLDVVLRAVERDVLPRPVLIQRGWTRPPRRDVPEVEVVDWLTGAEVQAALASSAVVVAQAAAGIAAATLAQGRRPLLLARLQGHGEHVDDHQQQIAAKLDELGLAVALEGDITRSDVERSRSAIVRPESFDAHSALPELVDRFILRDRRRRPF